MNGKDIVENMKVNINNIKYSIEETETSIDLWKQQIEDNKTYYKYLIKTNELHIIQLDKAEKLLDRYLSEENQQ